MDKKDNSKLNQKIIQLCLLNEKEQSINYINFLNDKIKFCEIRKEHLHENRPFKFQKKKYEEYNQQLKSIDDEIFDCLLNIEEEIGYIE